MFTSRLKVTFSFVLAVLTVFLLPSTTLSESSFAATCVSKACINVYTQDGQIVIEGKRSSSRVKTPAPSHIPIPKKKTVTKPRPVAPKSKSTYVRPPVPYKHKLAPTVKKKTPRPISLSDRLVKLLPIGKIAYQPARQALIKVPMIFWCDLPSLFATKVSIVGEVIDVAMRPAFVWSFGDGGFYVTTSSGAPYPQGGISHTYRNPGQYVVILVATWGGTWTFDGASRAITGEIRQTSISRVSVSRAPTIITR
ncbi:MAG: PKD domain-containing protein [Actinobacteria bacterium]|nr:PKD domain-containing protein [Actinomycetota bacterium]